MPAYNNIGGKDIGKGSIYVDVLYPDYSQTSAPILFTLSDGAASSDRIMLYANASGNSPYCATSATAGNAGASGIVADSSDNTKHTLGVLWETDNLRVIRDGVTDSTPDTTCDMPDDIDLMNIGQAHNAVTQANGIISNIRIYDEPTTEGD